MTDRRFSVPFDPDYFARRAASGDPLDPVEAFRHAYRTNLWAGPESRSGPGSGLDQTSALRTALPALLRRRQIRSLLDLPCGDWRWMATVDLTGIEYTGGDLLEELVDQCRRISAGRGRRFVRLDLTASPLPPADLLLCRDCLVHLSVEDIRRALANIRRSEITWLLTTTFPAQTANRDIVTGDWRPLNLQLPPFGFPEPVELLDEGCTEGEGRFRDKSLGLWRVSDLPAWPAQRGNS
jgi:SAM-dependent methyltransferase